MPWKGEKDVYRIWLSEIILQQTRVEQGLDYYEKFIRNYPDLHSLAGASDRKVFKLWEGLGYYSRCRNLLHTARYIRDQLNGRFPETYEKLKTLKGIGQYTAAAISSFAYNEPQAVVDGNVYRVLSRVFGIRKPVDTPEGKKYFGQLALMLLDKKKPGIYNQAIMDLGAVVCKPVQPLCGDCPFQKYCYGFLHKKTSSFPVRSKRKTIKKRWLYFFDLQNESRILIMKRTEKDIWRGLYALPVLETNTRLNEQQVNALVKKLSWLRKMKYRVLQVSDAYRQQLTHQAICAVFIRIQISKTFSLPPEWKWVPLHKLKDHAFPVVLKNYFGSAGT